MRNALYTGYQSDDSRLPTKILGGQNNGNYR